MKTLYNHNTKRKVSIKKSKKDNSDPVIFTSSNSMTFSRITLSGAIITSILIAYGGLKLFEHLNIVEHKKRAQYYQRKPVPNAQGIRLRLALICTLGRIGRTSLSSKFMIIYIVAITILSIIATIDLFRPIPSRIRLIAQCLIFGGVIIYGDIQIDTIRLPEGDFTLIKSLSIILSMIWFILCTNAINRFDGIQGQASGVTSIGSFSLFAVVTFIVLPSYENISPLITEQLTVTQTIAIALGIVSLLYTIVEYKPLGLIRDIGTTIFGFSLAYLALLGGAKVGTLIVTLSIVLLDSLWVIANRILIARKNPMKGDYTHFHHRCIANGRSRSEVRWFVRIWSIVLSILIILQGSNSINKRIIFILLALLFFGVNIYLFWIKKLPNEMSVHFKTDEVEHIE